MSMGMLLGNKAHLVNPGYTQIEEVEFDKTFTPVALKNSDCCWVYCVFFASNCTIWM